MGTSIWQATAKGNHYGSLKNNLEAEICIIGGGLCGTLTAMLLSEKGYRTVLLEAESLGCSTSGNNTGKATIQHGPIYHQIADKYTLEHARAYMNFNIRGQDLIRKVCNDGGLDIAERSSWIFGENESEHVVLLKEEKICKKLDMDCISRGEIPLPIKVTSALELRGQYQVNPLQIVYEAAAKARAQGCHIYEHSRVNDIKKGAKVKVITQEGFSVSADRVILACKYPCYGRGGTMIPRLLPERSYIVVSELKESFDAGMFINTGKPVLSLTGYDHEDKHYMLIGGRGCRVGKGNKNAYAELKQVAHKLLDVDDFSFCYAAQDLVTYDGMPFVGKMMGNNNIYVATGFNKWGITTSAGCACALEGLIHKGSYPEERYMTTKRRGDIFSKKFVTSSFETASEYIKTKLSDTEKQYPKSKGEAKIMKVNGKRCGVYRDMNNKLWAVELSCTHLGCGMYFNETERSWDCPCHGSRYGYDGKVLEGPATIPLKQMELK